VVAQAIPSYVMACFDITKSLADEISTLICRFWWAQMDNENKLHWVSWKTLSTQKDKVCTGYRDLHLLNLAMLMRQAWCILQNPESLCARLLTAWYCPSGDLLQVSEGPRISYTWRSVVGGFEALKNGLIWRIADGTQVRIWDDPWIPIPNWYNPQTKNTKGFCATLKD